MPSGKNTVFASAISQRFIGHGAGNGVLHDA